MKAKCIIAIFAMVASTSYAHPHAQKNIHSFPHSKSNPKSLFTFKQIRPFDPLKLYDYNANRIRGKVHNSHATVSRSLRALNANKVAKKIDYEYFKLLQKERKYDNKILKKARDVKLFIRIYFED